MADYDARKHLVKLRQKSSGKRAQAVKQVPLGSTRSGDLVPGADCNGLRQGQQGYGKSCYLVDGSIMLGDRHFRYPEHIRSTDMIAKIEQALSKSPALLPLVNDPKHRLGIYIQRLCWEYGLHPVWILITLQREQSLLTTDTERDWSFDAATGFVGQDRPGTRNPRYMGLHNQIWRCIRHTAWYLGFINPAMFGYRVGLRPTQPRFVAGETIDVPLLDSAHELDGEFMCNTAAEYAQLLYTPKGHTLEANWKIYETQLKDIFEDTNGNPT